MFFERPEGNNRAILVTFTFYDNKYNSDAEEFELLAEAASFETQTHMKANRSTPKAKFYIGEGKVEELKSLLAVHDAKTVLINHAISPSQERNLEAELDCMVLDRTGLILDIFSQRAQTYEGRLQVELAQCQHMATRLVRGWTHLERQQGGAGTRGGPGETQLELDKRMLRYRIAQIEKRLEKVRANREQSRRSRKKAEQPIVSIVGYTNAGKSTLFNTLTNAKVLEKDQLFATLDTTLRRLHLDALGDIVIADTVGFVKNLPHKLVDAFRATLEESIYADLLLHVIDAGDPDRQDKIASVNQVLKNIGAHDIPQVVIYNKIDLLTDEEPHLAYDEQDVPNAVWLSAKSGEGLDLLKNAMISIFASDAQIVKLNIPPNLGSVRNDLYNKGSIQHEEVDENGHYIIDAMVREKELQRIKKHKSITFLT